MPIFKTHVRQFEKRHCGLKTPGALLGEIDVNQGPLANSRYACSYWVDHLCQARHQDQIDLLDGGKVLTFLQKHFLHWLEALSLMGNISEGAAMVRNLEFLLTVSDAIHYNHSRYY